MPDFHLAQVNIGRLIAPIDSPEIAPFVAGLDHINALAERSPGFIWRLKSASNNATDIPYSDDDPTILVNMSVWDSIESLKAYVYNTEHVEYFRQRRAWFQKMDKPHYCLWWIPAGHIPTVAEAREHLEHYQQQGSTSFSFWFSQPFPAPVLTPA